LYVRGAGSSRMQPSENRGAGDGLACTLAVTCRRAPEAVQKNRLAESQLQWRLLRLWGHAAMEQQYVPHALWRPRAALEASAWSGAAAQGRSAHENLGALAQERVHNAGSVTLHRSRSAILTRRATQLRAQTRTHLRKPALKQASKPGRDERPRPPNLF